MQIKTTLRFYLTPVRMAVIKKTANADKDVGTKNPYALLCAVPMAICMEVLQKTKNIQLEAWLKQWSTCLASSGPKFKLQYCQRKKKILK
jgi:hypothetical protein